MSRGPRLRVSMTFVPFRSRFHSNRVRRPQPHRPSPRCRQLRSTRDPRERGVGTSSTGANVSSRTPMLTRIRTPLSTVPPLTRRNSFAWVTCEKTRVFRFIPETRPSDLSRWASVSRPESSRLPRTRRIRHCCPIRVTPQARRNGIRATRSITVSRTTPPFPPSRGASPAKR